MLDSALGFVWIYLFIYFSNFNPRQLFILPRCLNLIDQTVLGFFVLLKKLKINPL